MSDVLENYQCIKFVEEVTSEGLATMDCVPSSWIFYDQKKGQLVTRFMPPPYNDDTLPFLTDLIKKNITAPDSWPSYPIELVGHARKYADVREKLKKLEKQDFVYTTDEEGHAKQRSMAISNIYRKLATQSDQAVRLMTQLEYSQDGDNESDDESGLKQTKNSARKITNKGAGSSRKIKTVKTAKTIKRTVYKKVQNTFEVPKGSKGSKTQKGENPEVDVTDGLGGGSPAEKELPPPKANSPPPVIITPEDMNDIDQRPVSPLAGEIIEKRLEGDAVSSELFGEDPIQNLSPPSPIISQPSEPDQLSPDQNKVTDSPVSDNEGNDTEDNISVVQLSDLQVLSRLESYTSKISPETKLLWIALKKLEKTVENQMKSFEKLCLAIKLNLRVKLDVMTLTGFFQKYQSRIIGSLEDFEKFNQNLKGNDSFRDDFMQVLETLLEETVYKTISSVLKRLFKTEILKKFVAQKLASKDSPKIILKGTAFCETLYGLVCNFFKTAEGNIFTEQEFFHSLAEVLQSVRDWDGGRGKR